MASDIEEPFRLNFQADSIHSGSISFGRFETEALCWERRSSFSHNRYLEEVEKFSKPGSVTEKKAYFEAHFKKKKLQSKSSLASQNETESCVSENEMSENVGSREKFEPGHEGGHTASSGKSDVLSTEVRKLQPEALEPEDTRVLYSRSIPSHVFDNGDAVDRFAELVMKEDVCETENEKLHLGNSVTDAKPRANNISDCDAESSEVSSKTTFASGNYTSERDDSVSSNRRLVPPAKVGHQSEREISKLTSRKVVVQTKKKMTRETSRDFAKQPAERENDSSVRVKPGIHLPEAATSTMMSVHRIVKHTVCHDVKEKLLQQSRSGQKFRTKKPVLSRPSASEKVDSLVHDVPNRRSSSSERIHKTQNRAISSGSNEQAEPRKEEKLAGDAKQLRKSLNLKAKPLPSFYNEPEQSHKSKAVVNNNSKLAKVANKSPSPQIGVSSAVHSTNSRRSPEAIPGRPVHPNKSGKSSNHTASHHQINHAATDAGIAKKEGKEKLKHTSPWKHRVSEVGKSRQDHNGVGAERGRSSVTRKDSRDIHLRSHSRSRSLAVGVVS